MARHRAPPGLEDGQRLGDLGDRLLSGFRVDDRHISRMANRDPIVLQVHVPRRARGEHVEAVAHPRRMANLADIGMQVRHAHERAVPERREGVQDIVGRDRAVAPLLDEKVGVDDAASDVVRLVAAHEEQVRGGKHRDGHARAGQTFCHLDLRVGRQRRQFRRVADRDAPTHPELLRQLAHQIDVEVVRRVAEIEMHVDVDVELAGEVEHATNLAGAVGVIPGRGSDHLGASLSPSTSRGSVPGLFVSPSCGKTQSSISIAQRYSSTSAWTSSKPRIPTLGSTSTWVRIRVAPFLMQFSSVSLARA